MALLAVAALVVPAPAAAAEVVQLTDATFEHHTQAGELNKHLQAAMSEGTSASRARTFRAPGESGDVRGVMGRPGSQGMSMASTACPDSAFVFSPDSRILSASVFSRV